MNLRPFDPDERAASDLDLVVAGIENGITMVEAKIAHEVSEQMKLSMLWLGHTI